MLRLILSPLLAAVLISSTALAQVPRSPSRPPPPKGTRQLGVAVTEAEDGDFSAAFALALAAGMETGSLALSWDDLETSPGVYNPAVDWLAIADLYYSSIGMAISIEINPIDTVVWRVPAYLAGLPIDDPLVVAAYRNLLDWVFTKIPNLTLVDFVIGNEIDGVLGFDPQSWARYESFFAQVAPYARSLRSGLRVGSKITLTGLLGPASTLAAGVNQHTDAVLTTHYALASDYTVLPPASIHSSFDAITAAYPGRKIHFSELGYPSGALCLSSQAQQAEFIRQAFSAWDDHRGQIELIEFVWLTDISPATLDFYRKYYGINDPIFLEYLGTLGLRTHPRKGRNKLAYNALVEEARWRGW